MRHLTTKACFASLPVLFTVSMVVTMRIVSVDELERRFQVCIRFNIFRHIQQALQIDLLALLWPLKLAQCLLLMLFLPREVKGIENIDWSCSQLLMPLRCQGDAGACVGGWQGLCGLLPHGARPLLLQPVREVRAATEASQKWQRNCTAAAPL